MAPYLTATELEVRLASRFGITAEVTDGDADIASDELDASGPFVGERQAGGQVRAFPRTLNPDGTDNASAEVPPAVLDWVTLRAYALSVDEEPAVKSESIMDSTTVYAEPRRSQTERRMERLLAPYRASQGLAGTITVSSSMVD